MTVVSSQEFALNQNKYFDIAMKEQVFVQRGNIMFNLSCADKGVAPVKERVYYEPDEEFYQSIPLEEVRDRLHKVIEKLYAKE